MQHFIVSIVIMTFFLLLCLYGEYKKKPLIRAIGKMMSSNCFLYIAFSSYWFYDVPSELRYTMMWIIIGLVCSWWGDLFLLSRTSVVFLLGLISFLLAHIFYIVAFIFAQVDWYLTVSAMGVSIVPAIAIGYWLNPNLGTMRIPVYIYMIIISCMLSFAIGAWAYGGLWNLPVGAFVFYASDIFVARDRFKTADKWNFLIGGPLYFIGQVFLASTPIWAN